MRGSPAAAINTHAGVPLRRRQPVRGARAAADREADVIAMPADATRRRDPQNRCGAQGRRAPISTRPPLAPRLTRNDRRGAGAVVALAVATEGANLGGNNRRRNGGNESCLTDKSRERTSWSSTSVSPGAVRRPYPGRPPVDGAVWSEGPAWFAAIPPGPTSPTTACFATTTRRVMFGLPSAVDESERQHRRQPGPTCPP